MCYESLITHDKMLCGHKIDAVPFRNYSPECKCETQKGVQHLGSKSKSVPCEDCIANMVWVKNSEDKWMRA